MSKVQVLVAAMNQQDYSLLDKMNIQSDVIVGNQCNVNRVDVFEYNGNQAMYLNFAERGVGLNRNNVLMRADGDICIFADEDVVYDDNYSDKIISEYDKNPNADIIVFNFLESRNGEELHRRISKSGYVGRKGVSSFATFMISCKLSQLRKRNICFHQMFGGGTIYGHGEDSIFLKECLDKKMKVYVSSEIIGTVFHNESTWYGSLDDKYFMDTGALYAQMYPKLAKAIAAYHVIKHHNRYKNFGVKKAYKKIVCGIESYR